MAELQVSEARASLLQVLDRVGRVAAVVRSGRRSRIPAGGGLVTDRAEELVAEIRADRDAD